MNLPSLASFVDKKKACKRGKRENYTKQRTSKRMIREDCGIREICEDCCNDMIDKIQEASPV